MVIFEMLGSGIIAGILTAIVTLLTIKLSEERRISYKKDKEIDGLREELNKSISSSGIKSLNDPAEKANVNEQFIPAMQALFNVYARIIKSDKDHADPELHVNMAKSYSITKDWEKAIEQFELSMPDTKTNWNVQFLYGVACANSRNSSHYLKAIEAYSNAIAYIPDDADARTKAKLYNYRGSIYKRLGRLDEAINDLKYALANLPTDSPKKSDALYNLACVYAMQNNTAEFNNVMARLETAEDDDTIDRVHNGLKTYAPNFEH